MPWCGGAFFITFHGIEEFLAGKVQLSRCCGGWGGGLEHALYARKRHEAGRASLSFGIVLFTVDRSKPENQHRKADFASYKSKPENKLHPKSIPRVTGLVEV